MFLQFFPRQMWRQKTGVVIKLLVTSHILQQQAPAGFQSKLLLQNFMLCFRFFVTFKAHLALLLFRVRHAVEICS
jgi:hypothetical protein